MKVFIALANLVAFASASNFVAYSGGDFSGASASLSSCGCSDIPFHGSYQWFADGQSGRMFNTLNCQDVAVFTLSSSSDTSQTTGIGWNSIDIIC
jgi:MiAMP1